MKREIRLLTMLAILLAFCYSKVQAQGETIVFTPQWTAQAQFAGYYVAEAKGFYRKAGLKVKIEHPSATQPAMSRLRNNQCQATTLQLCQALEIIDQGIPLVNILQTSMNNAMVIVSARGKDPLTQKGARVGIWSVDFGQLAICMSIKDHLDYEWIRFAQNVNLFLSGALDATLAMSYNEYYQLVQAGIETNDKNVYRFCDHGYNVQEDGVYMTREYYSKHKDQAQRARFGNDRPALPAAKSAFLRKGSRPVSRQIQQYKASLVSESVPVARAAHEQGENIEQRLPETRHPDCDEGQQRSHFFSETDPSGKEKGCCTEGCRRPAEKRRPRGITHLPDPVTPDNRERISPQSRRRHIAHRVPAAGLPLPKGDNIRKKQNCRQH